MNCHCTKWYSMRKKVIDNYLMINSLFVFAFAVLNFQNNSEFTMWCFYKCTFIGSFQCITQILVTKARFNF